MHGCRLNYITFFLENFTNRNKMNLLFYTSSLLSFSLFRLRDFVHYSHYLVTRVERITHFVKLTRYPSQQVKPALFFMMNGGPVDCLLSLKSSLKVATRPFTKFERLPEKSAESEYNHSTISFMKAYLVQAWYCCLIALQCPLGSSEQQISIIRLRQD